MTTLRNMSVDLMKTHDISMVNIRRLWEGLHGHEIIEDYDTLPITSRPDLPVIYPGGRGSIKRALDLTVTDRNQALIARLEDDMYAQSSKKPREALWKTWSSIGFSLEPTAGTAHRRTSSQSGGFLQGRPLQIPTELLQPGTPRTPTTDQTAPNTICAVSDQERHSIHHQRHRPHSLQRLLRSGTSEPSI